MTRTTPMGEVEHAVRGLTEIVTGLTCDWLALDRGAETLRAQFSCPASPMALSRWSNWAGSADLVIAWRSKLEIDVAHGQAVVDCRWDRRFIVNCATLFGVGVLAVLAFGRVFVVGTFSDPAMIAIALVGVGGVLIFGVPPLWLLARWVSGARSRRVELVSHVDAIIASTYGRQG